MPSFPYFSENDEKSMEEIRGHEGFIKSSEEPTIWNPLGYSGTIGYYDTEGYLTKGIGHRVIGMPQDKEMAGQAAPEHFMSWDDTDALFEKDFASHRDAASESPFWGKASESQQRGLMNLTFNMGNDWWKTYKTLAGKEHAGFPKFTEAANSGDWGLAADELVNSKWFNQVGYRAPEVVSMIRPPVEYPEQGNPMELVGGYTPNVESVMGQVASRGE